MIMAVLDRLCFTCYRNLERKMLLGFTLATVLLQRNGQCLWGWYCHVNGSVDVCW